VKELFNALLEESKELIVI